MANSLALVLVWISILFSPSLATTGDDQFRRDGSVIELTSSNFDAAISSFDFLLVDFYAPWCGHCKRLAPELDAAAPVLAGLSKPIFIAKVDAEKYSKIASKYEIDGFPTLKFFIHGVPIEYTGPRKAEILVQYLKKFVAPDVSHLESDTAIQNFVDSAGKNFPIFLGFGLDESLMAEFASKYKKKAWFAVAKDFSEDMMVVYDFDKVPALVLINPKYGDRSVFYGPFEGDFLEDFIKQSLLPLTVPINPETLKLLKEEDRKIVLTIVQDETDENSAQLIRVLRSAANANRDLIFSFVGVQQWADFADRFDAIKSVHLPKMLVWDGNEEYELVVGSEKLKEEDRGSQISRFLEGYRQGNIIKKKLKGPSLIGFINSLISLKSIYLVVFIVAILMFVQQFGGQSGENQPVRGEHLD
ncbi:hypothetical protein LUZ61_004076 [Rhynchospora tenuis]|uniref:Thioredoxin domain-containing protein n=1 Tax=Rhynchospora tenuis TaxID=198213 RepID=A0AAD5ZM66_9POAL|nr:hypothetical protein LUZ61_004076 [Rhynchospora tenuis]